MIEPVLIVGAGPVGLTAALMMARHGTPVRIIDQNDAPTTLSKALVLWRRTLQVIDPVIPWEHFLDGHVKAERGLFFDKGRKIAELSFEHDEHGLPAGVFIPQSDTEALLIDGLSKHDITVERQIGLSTFTRDDDGVSCTLSTGEVLRTPWLIGCDGGHSTVRHTLGLEFPGETVDQCWLLADVLVDGDAPEGAAIIESGPEGPVAIFPVAKNRWRVIAAIESQEENSTPADPTLTDVQHVLSTRTSLDWQAREALWLTNFAVNERQIAEYVHGRVILAGDAAHVHSPAGGQGMNTGMQDAANLAWKVAIVMHNAASPSLLSTYQAERHPVGAAVVKDTGRMLKMAMITNPVLRAIRGTGIHLAMSIPALQRAVGSMITEEIVNYRKGPLAVKGHGTHRSGDAFPDMPLEDGLATDLLRGHEAVLFSDAGDGPTTLGSGGLPITLVRAPEITSACGGDVLVRPDGVIAAIGEDIGPWIDRLCQGTP